MTKGRAINIVRRFFPEVQEVQDAKESLSVEVSKADSDSAEVKKHGACAMAVACKRKTRADGVIVSVGTAYVIQGTTAYRYRVPQSVAREVVSFDRHAGFMPGQYQLNKPSRVQGLGKRRVNPAKEGKGKPHPHKGTLKHHRTEGIRTVLANL